MPYGMPQVTLHPPPKRLLCTRRLSPPLLNRRASASASVCTYGSHSEGRKKSPSPAYTVEAGTETVIFSSLASFSAALPPPPPSLSVRISCLLHPPAAAAARGRMSTREKADSGGRELL